MLRTWTVRLLPFMLAYGSVGLGHWWGVSIWYPGRTPNILTEVAWASLGFMCAGVGVEQFPRAHGSKRIRWHSAAVLAYSASIYFFEPFLWVDDELGLSIAVGVLASLVLALFSV